MSDVFIVTWTPDNVELRQVKSVGTWELHMPPIRSFELNRPTRIDRLHDEDSGGGLHRALKDLFADIEVDLPIWLLLPGNWVQFFQADRIDLASDEMQLSNLMWAAQQRLSGDITRFRVVLPSDLSTPKLDVRMVQYTLIEAFNNAVMAAGIEISGIWYEPEWGTEYNFEIPRDLRESEPADILDTTARKPLISIPRGVFIAAGIVAVVLVVYFLLLPSGSEREPIAEGVPDSAAIAAVTGSADSAVTPEVSVTQVEDKGKKKSFFAFLKRKPKEKAADEAVLAEQAEKEAFAASSPINQIVQVLPSGAGLQLAILSPVDCRIEITGLSDPKTWVDSIAGTPFLKSVKLEQGYRSGNRTYSVVRFTETSWPAGGGARNLDSWTSLASAKNMTPKGRSARGDFSSALDLVNALWSDPIGFEKIYLARDKEQWVVTVQ